MRLQSTLLGVLLLSSVAVAAEKEHRYRMSLRDEFIVAPKKSWKVEGGKYLMLRFANVKIAPTKGEDFSLMLYFKCDTRDLANFDSIEKMEKAVAVSSKSYLANSVEKEVKIKRMKLEGSYGCYVILTDADVAKKKKLEKGEFIYLTRGMIRLSPDSALGFSLMTNSIDSPEYREIMDYIQSFIKKPKSPAGENK